MAKNPNENCLRGVKCPKCGSFGDFKTVVASTMRVSDEGTEELGGDTEFEDDAWAQCCECKFEATWWHFQEENHGKTKPKPRPVSAEKQIEDVLETGKFGSGSVDNLLDALDKRFNRVSVSFGRSDVDDELEKDLTDEEWERVQKTVAWGRIKRGMVKLGYDGVDAALEEAGLK